MRLASSCRMVSHVQDDALGDPGVGGLNQSLLAEMAAQQDDGQQSLDEASIEASIEDGDDPYMEDEEGDADSPAVKQTDDEGASSASLVRPCLVATPVSRISWYTTHKL